MDSSTLGIEPDFSLVKHKKLAGGGYLKLVNQTVPITLRRLGYSEEDVAAICEAVETTGTVETSPLLKPEHLAVFDCAVRCGPQSKRSIRPLAHVEMVAAIQPFLAGGVSKTINMPNDATEADVEEVFMAAWKLGVKAIPVYRDGSKLSQPLTTVGEEPEDIEDILADPETTAQKVVEKVLIKHALARRDLPTKRKGYTQKARIGDHKVYVRTGEYEDGTLGEIWIDMHKEGAAFRAMANALAMAVSIALQHGTPLEEFVEAFCFMKFEPNGVVQGNDRIRNCTSVVDYIFRELAVNYLGRDDLAHAPAIIAPGTTDTGPKPDTDSVVEFIAIGRIEAKSMGYEGDACRNCGNFTLVRSGTCCVCKSCGETSGCS
jgi:ribonucleoside-diphosphate reductase alpha chain